MTVPGKRQSKHDTLPQKWAWSGSRDPILNRGARIILLKRVHDAEHFKFDIQIDGGEY